MVKKDAKGLDWKKIDAMMYKSAHASRPYNYFREFIANYLKEGNTVVDVGCGLGLTFPQMKKIVGEKGRVIGVDVSISALKAARRKLKDFEYVHATGTHIPLKDNFADVVLCMETIPQAVGIDKDADWKIPKEMYRITKPGGIMIAHYTGLELLETLIEIWKKHGMKTEASIRQHYDIVDGQHATSRNKIRSHSLKWVKETFKKLGIPVSEIKEDCPDYTFFEEFFLMQIREDQEKLFESPYSHIVYSKKPNNS